MTYKQAQSRAGKAGRGESKRRTREQCRAAALALWAQRRAQQAAKQTTETKGDS